MNQRCFNPNSASYKNYGAKGIEVCEEWKGRKGFDAFYKWSIENGYNDTLTIDRIDVNGNYEPSNCRWVTQKEQMNNTSINVYIEYMGETHTMKEWAEKFEIPYKRLWKRLHSGWSVEKAFTTGKQKNQYV